ncbi:MAG: hypothetical protein Q8O03_00675 [Nanoarchaeota archaeon]|nr:hypothetical protein [Nanoarchaeota archaeon]
MDSQTAVRTLTKGLGDKLGRQMIIEDVYKELLIKNASHAYQIDNPVLVDFMGGHYSYEGTSVNGRDMVNLLDLLLAKNSSFADANYIFLGNTTGGEKSFTDTRFIVTAYTLIGEDEVRSLEKNFYKDVPLDILFAMDRLGIQNFVRIYRLYTDSKKFDLEAKLAKEFIDFVSKLKYDGDEETSMVHFEFLGGLDKLNKDLRALGVTKGISTTEDRKSKIEKYPTLVHKKNIAKVVEELQTKKSLENSLLDGIIFDFDKYFLAEFFNFVFFLPYEDQNITVNKNILKLHSDQIDYIRVMVKEYVSGDNFGKYFECLDGERQKRVVHSLSTISEKRPIYDSFLWSKGFKNLSLNHLELYKNDSKGFIEYFTRKTLEEKKAILKDVMDCEFTNEGAIDWLNENEQDLIREVGFNG